MWPIKNAGRTSNPLYDNTLCVVFSQFENNVGIICVCMVSFGRFFKLYIRPFIRNSANNTEKPVKYYKPEGENNDQRNRRRIDTLDGSLFRTTVQVCLVCLL